MNKASENTTGYPSIDKPWLKYYSDEAINTPLPECTIYEYLVQNNKDYPSDIAINYLGRKITYKELFENIDKAAAAFTKVSVREKEIVTIALPSIPEALYCVYALNKIGAVANMIHPLAGKEETVNYINEVHSKVAVIFDGAYETIADEAGRTSIEKVIVVSPTDSLPLSKKVTYGLKENNPNLDKELFFFWKDFIENGMGIIPKVVKKDCHEMAIVSHTGGTTGEPKGCMISDYSIIAEVWQAGCNFIHSRQERMMPVIPPFHNYSLVNTMIEPLSFGFEVIMLPQYEPERFADYVEEYRPNHVNSIPAFWEAILKIPNIQKADMTCLDIISYGGEMMNEETERAVNEILLAQGAKRALLKGIGCTEMTSVATVTYDECNVSKSVGIPLVRVNCKIVEQGTTTEMIYGTIGEICFSGPTMMMGYYDNPEATNNIIKIHPDGERWLHTGDLGYIDENGVVFVSGRIKRILITRDDKGQGTKMFPDRIEKVIYTLPYVESCCVIGIPDEERVNYPKAFVVLKKQDKQVSNEIIDICKKNLPEYMVPVEIEFLTDMPRTSSGKIDYRALEGR